MSGKGKCWHLRPISLAATAITINMQLFNIFYAMKQE